MHSPDILVAALGTLRDTLAERVGVACRAAIADRGRATLAITGGSSFATLGGGLAAAGVPWQSTHVVWGDERAVPPEHPESNYRAAREVWLGQVPLPPENVHRMPADEPDLNAAADAYAATLGRCFGPGGRLDVALLGAGADGHVCSLFPGSAATAERRRTVVAVHDSPKPPRRRLTLTLPVLTEARLVIVIALGSAKRDAVRAALQSPASPLPLALVVRSARSVLLLLDPDACPEDER